MTPKQNKLLRSLPAVGELLEHEDVRHWTAAAPRATVVAALRTAIDRMRERIVRDGEEISECDVDALVHEAEEILVARSTSSLRSVINATGIVLHTGLGRSPMSADAVEAVAEVAGGYCNLEYDLETGRRGRRTSHVCDLLCELTGAQAATVVNNNAAAVVLILKALCDGREVIVSRGQLVEIGGSFRMPDVMKAGGAVLREVGTTNRTRVADYKEAINEQTAALLRVHHSNYRIMGFTEEPSIEELVGCAREYDLPVIDDLGSGALFDLAEVGLPAEPFVRRSIAAGSDLVCFSGDKLLGGPQSGIIAGRRDLIARIESHPLMRTYRVDKLVLAALDATLRHFMDEASAMENIAPLRMLHTSTEELADRARELETRLSAALPDDRFFVSSDVSYAGGGSLPGEGLATVVIRWTPARTSVDRAAAALRHTDPPVIVRVSDDAICLDLRTIPADEFEPLTAAVVSAADDETPCQG